MGLFKFSRTRDGQIYIFTLFGKYLRTQAIGEKDFCPCVPWEKKIYFHCSNFQDFRTLCELYLACMMSSDVVTVRKA